MRFGQALIESVLVWLCATGEQETCVCVYALDSQVVFSQAIAQSMRPLR